MDDPFRMGGYRTPHRGFGVEYKVRTDPDRRNGRLWRRLGALLNVVTRLAHACFLLLGKLCVAASLLGGLGLRVVSVMMVFAKRLAALPIVWVLEYSSHSFQ